VSASMTIRNTLRTIDSQNILAKLEGSDPTLKDEYVIYTCALGSLWDRGSGERRSHLPRRARQCRGYGRTSGDRPGVHKTPGAAEAVDSFSVCHGGGAGSARIAVLL